MTAIILPTKPLRKSPRAFRKATRRLSHKENGSKAQGKQSPRKAKQRLKVQKIHLRIANLRKDALDKISSHLTEQYKSIASHDLDVSGMLKNHRLSRAISDLGFYELRRKLEYKATLYGNTLIVPERFFPSSKMGSSCGSIMRSGW